MSLRHAGCFESVIDYRVQQFAFAFKSQLSTGHPAPSKLRQGPPEDSPPNSFKILLLGEDSLCHSAETASAKLQ